MKGNDFILVKVWDEHEYYEVGRLVPYDWNDACYEHLKGSFYVEGIAQNNGDIFNFSVHLGNPNIEGNIKIKYKELTLDNNKYGDGNSYEGPVKIEG